MCVYQLLQRLTLSLSSKEPFVLSKVSPDLVNSNCARGDMLIPMQSSQRENLKRDKTIFFGAVLDEVSLVLGIQGGRGRLGCFKDFLFASLIPCGIHVTLSLWGFWSQSQDMHP